MSVKSSVKSRHSSSKKDKIRKKEKRKKVEESEEDIESSEEELDLTKECHPIGYYMNDRHEMINQMFSVIKGNKLKAMLPPVLKDLDLEYLKLQCLDQLLGMSEKRIQCILEGEILDTSSESEVPDSDDDKSEAKNDSSSGSSSEKMDESHDEEANGSGNRRKKRRSNSTSEGKSKVQKVDAENPPEKGKTLLEILELEMRARAIRALLKQGGNENANDNKTEEATNQNGDKEITGEVVDLTECEDEELPIPPRKEKPESDIDKKVSKFEEKIEKSVEKVNQNQEDEKAKRLQAELELRNKLFKKKIYRTRQQRMENDEEDRAVIKQEIESEENAYFNDIVVKEEPKEPEDIVVEDPEEGEVSTSEDEYPVEIKQEPVEPEPEPEPEVEVEPEPEPEPINYEPKVDAEGERLAAMDNGAFVMNENVDYPTEFLKDTEESQNSVVEEKIPEEMTEPLESTNLDPEKETEQICEETSWRERWLKKDGVQKLVKSSKIYAKVKKRIVEKSLKSKEEAALVPSELNSDSSNSNFKLEAFEGSIEEYERLAGKSLDKSKVKEKPQEEVQKDVKAEESEPPVLKEKDAEESILKDLPEEKDLSEKSENATVVDEKVDDSTEILKTDDEVN